MKKENLVTYILSAIQIALAIFIFYKSWNIDKLTTGLLIFILVVPAIIDVIITRDLQSFNPDIKKLTINKNFDYLAIVSYIVSTIIILYSIFYFNLYIISAGVMVLSYANVIKNWSNIKYDKNILIYRSNTINLATIKKIDKEKDRIIVTDALSKTIIIKLKDEDKIKQVEKILKRK